MPKQVITGVDGRNIVVNNYDVNAGVIGSIDISHLEERGGRLVNTYTTGRNLRWLGPGRGWSLEEGYLEEEDLTPGEDHRKVKTPLQVLDIDLRPDDILLFLKSPYDMSLRQIKRLYSMSPTDLRLKILLHHHITFPLTNILLLLLGLPFVLRKEQHSNFLGISIALAICLGYFALDVIMRDLGTQDFIPPVLAAWFSVVFCGSLGICIFDSIRT
jgi:lipopolysaccharide export LptBFGC system permease protein LptF